MKRIVLTMLGGSVLLGLTACGQQDATEQGYDYPETRRVDVVETLHGEQVSDPYRWLEDLDGEDTAEWVAAQNEITFRHLESIDGREQLEERLTRLWDYERYSAPSYRGGRWFYSYNDGLQDHSVIYTLPELEAEPEVLIDPNSFSEDGTTALSTMSVSESGEYVAYGKSEGGSDWQTLYVRDVDSGDDLEDRIEWSKFSTPAWNAEGDGFFYGRYPEPEGDRLTAANANHKLYFHALGTNQSEDRLVYERPDRPDWRFDPELGDDGRYLVITVHEGTDRRNRVFYMDLGDAVEPNLDADVVEVIDDFDGGYHYIDNDGSTFYFHTTAEAPRGRVIAVDFENPARENWTTVIPQRDDVIQGVEVAGDQFAVNYMQDAHSRLEIVSREGETVQEIELPTLGSVGSVNGNEERDDLFFSFTSFLYPTSVFRYELGDEGAELFREPEVPGFDRNEYVTRQVFYESMDGTEIPMFITHREGLEMDGSTPTLLYGYGGFNISLTPRFSVENLAWIEQGGIYAQANLRGGGEYGREWHQAGMKENKQNVFDDFAAAAEYLIAEDYTSSEYLGIYGRSNGGLLVGATLNQRPDLFGAAIPAVGVMDMLRFHKFTVGSGWTPDYGNPENAEDFRVLRAYSPYHNIRSGHDYPPVLVTTADHDDRVVPGHSFKYTARLQHRQAGDNPMLIRVETRAGHGAGLPTHMRIEEARDRLGFLAHHLGLELD